MFQRSMWMLCLPSGDYGLNPYGGKILLYSPSISAVVLPLCWSPFSFDG